MFLRQITTDWFQEIFNQYFDIKDQLLQQVL